MIAWWVSLGSIRKTKVIKEACVQLQALKRATSSVAWFGSLHILNVYYDKNVYLFM